MRKIALLLVLSLSVSGLTACGIRVSDTPAPGSTPSSAAGSSSDASGDVEPIVIHTEKPAETQKQTELQTETAAPAQAETAAAPAATPETQPQTSAPASVEAAGSWKQNSATGSRYFTADLTGSDITVYLNNAETGDASVYWAGSFDAAALEEGSVYTSENDHGRTDSLTSASHADTKDFTFTGGTLQFKYSKGVTQTISLVKDGSSVPQTASVPETTDAGTTDANAEPAPQVPADAQDTTAEETTPQTDVIEITDSGSVDAGTTMTAFDNVNIRTGMSTDSEIIGSLSDGDTVTVYDIQDGWAQIDYEGTTAYVSAQYLS